MTTLCPTLCNPMKYSTPGFPILHQFFGQRSFRVRKHFPVFRWTNHCKKKRGGGEKPTINSLSIWVSHVFNLFLLKNLSECHCGLLTEWGFTLEGSYPSYGLYAPFYVQSLLRFPFLTTHNSTWLYLEEELELSWFHLYLPSHIKVNNAILVGFFLLASAISFN